MPAASGADSISGPEEPAGAPGESRRATGWPRLVVGLGNPGPEYDGTRHNVGFRALDLLAGRLGAKPAGLKAGGRRIGDLYRSPDGAFALLWPLTYMNLSGGAVAAALRRLEAAPDALLVITDDFHLPLGALRARAGGSAGGHKGLLSIERALGTRAYPRLRLGVGDERAGPAGDAVDFVLSRFRGAERRVVDEMVETASFAAEDWARGCRIEELQARYNRRSPQAEPPA